MDKWCDSAHVSSFQGTQPVGRQGIQPKTVTERCIEKEGAQQKRMSWRGARHPESVAQNDTSFGMRQRDAAHALPGGGPIRPVSNSPSHWYWRGRPEAPTKPQTHVRLLCLFSYEFIITLWVEFAREICPPVRIQSSVPKSRAKPNSFLGRISRGTRSGQIPRRRVSLSHRRCRRRCPGCGLAGEESLRRMSRGRQLPRCLRVVWRGGRKVCPCRAGNGCWRMGFLVRLE